MLIGALVFPVPTLADSDSRESGRGRHYGWGQSQNRSPFSYRRPYRYPGYGYDNRYDNRNGYNYSLPGNRYGYSNVPRNYWQMSQNAIERGIRQGNLSQSEVRKLREVQRDIIRKEAAYRRDGRITQNEREELREEYEDFRDELRHQLNDDERRDRYYYW